MPNQNQYPSQFNPTPITQDEVIEKLKHAFAFDFLDIDEFEKRLSIASQTHNAAELNTLIHDLPVIEQKATPQPTANNISVKEDGTILSILSGVSRKGKWRPPRHLKIITFMGGADLNFTKVEFPPGVTEVTVFSVMGGVEIIIPPGVNVDVSGFAIMGSFEDHSHNDQAVPGAPTLKIRGFAFMGGVEIRAPRQNIMERILKKFNIL